MEIIINKNITYDTETHSFIKNVDYISFSKYLRGVFSNIEKFDEYFYNPLIYKLKQIDYYNFDLINIIRDYYLKNTAFSYREAFQIGNPDFRAIVFGSINVIEMINNLGATRINVEGKELNLRVYKEDGSYEMKKSTSIYELHKINCSLLQIEDNYAVKCWCTSTDKEHWLWIEPQYAKNGALEAIASTMRVYENMIPFILNIKRQGDVLLFEMSQEIMPEGDIIPLTAKQYFNLLISQS